MRVRVKFQHETFCRIKKSRFLRRLTSMHMLSWNTTCEQHPKSATSVESRKCAILSRGVGGGLLRLVVRTKCFVRKNFQKTSFCFHLFSRLHFVFIFFQWVSTPYSKNCLQNEHCRIPTSKTGENLI